MRLAFVCKHSRVLGGAGLQIRQPCWNRNFRGSLRTPIVPCKPESEQNILKNVAVLCKEGRVARALDTLDRFEPRADCSTYERLLRACKSLVDAKRTHGHIIKSRLEYFLEDSLVATYSRLGSLNDTQEMCRKLPKRKTIAWNCLIGAYVKNGSLGSARRIFENMSDRNVASWNTIIAAYAKSGHGEEAMNLYKRMLKEGVRPNRVTFINILYVCSKPACLSAYKLIHKHFLGSGLHSDVALGTSLVKMYGKCESLQDARRVFDRMLVRNARSWNTMIAVCNQLGEADAAIGLFLQMQQEGTIPDHFTFSCTLGACTSLTALIEGTWVHDDVVKNGSEIDLVLAADLIAMYGSCGSLSDAKVVFDKTPKQDVVVWSAIISMYTKHGDGKTAIEYFKQMQDADVTPNSITIASALSACNQANLFDEGHKLFESMLKEYGSAPAKEHYMCMVDLLGRAGLLDEAEEVARQMPLESRIAAWAHLLYACKVHGNLMKAEHAARCVLGLDPKRRSTYAELCSIYTAAGRWDDAEKVKETMAVHGLK